MFQIILFILKILGILLLVILGLFLALVLCILFAPVRYRGEGSFYGKPKGAVKVSWLWPLLSVRASYETELEASIRILGIPLFRKMRQGEEGKRAAKTKRKRRRKRETEELEEALGAIPEGEEEELVLSAQELSEEEAGERGENQPPEPEMLYKETEPETESAEGIPEGKMPEDEMPEDEIPEEEIPEDETPEEETPEEETGGFWKRKRKNGRRRHPKKGFVKRIRAKALLIWLRLKAAVLGLRAKAGRLLNQKDAIASFLADEENQRTFRLLKRQALRILKHLKPTRLSGHITFGLEDPYTMGRVLSIAAFAYPLYGRRLILSPVFDRQMIEGELKIRGRIRAGVFVSAAIRILLNKNFRKQLRKFLN